VIPMLMKADNLDIFVILPTLIYPRDRPEINRTGRMEPFAVNLGCLARIGS